MPNHPALDHLELVVEDLILYRTYTHFITDKIAKNELKEALDITKKYYEFLIMQAFEDGQKMQGKSSEDYLNEKFGNESQS
jgi:hypothetical protein